MEKANLKGSRAVILTRSALEFKNGRVPEPLLNQIRVCREFAYTNGMKVFGEFFISGEDIVEEFDGLILFFKEHSISHLIVTNPNRISRKLDVALKIMKDIENAGIKVISISEFSLSEFAKRMLNSKN